MTKQYTAQLPFSGFYETLHGEKIDNDIEYYIDCRCENMTTEQANEFSRDIWDNVEYDFKRYKNDYSKEYVNRFASDYDLDDMVFESVSSPKYYNYTTDRIFVSIPDASLKDIIRRTDKDTLKATIKERFTSYDGFISHYPNTLDEWGNMSKTGIITN